MKNNSNEVWDEVVDPDTISEYEDSRVNWEFFFKCKAEAEAKRLQKAAKEAQ